MQVELDRAGVGEMLKSSEVRTVVVGIAEQIAGDVRTSVDGAPVVVDTYTTDRAAASVTIKDARGRLWEVRDGVLTRAAGRTGLEVTSK